MSCRDYEGVMLVLCTPVQVKCYLTLFITMGEVCLQLKYFCSTFVSTTSRFLDPNSLRCNLHAHHSTDG